MHKSYHRKGLYRATLKVPLSPAFGLRTGKSTELLLLLHSDYLQVQE